MIQRQPWFTALLAGLFIPSLAEANPISQHSITTSIVTATVMLAFVIACFLGLAWLTRKLRLSGFQTSASTRSMQMIETLPVGREEKICIVKIGSEYKVLGVTPQQISLLDTLDQFETQPSEKKPQAWEWAQHFLKNNPSQAKAQ